VHLPAPSSPRDEGQCRTGSSSNPTRRLRKIYCGAVEIQWPAHLREEENAGGGLFQHPASSRPMIASSGPFLPGLSILNSEVKVSDLG